MNKDVSTRKTQAADAVRYLNPVADICDEDGKVLLRLELPGVDREHLDIQVEGSQLRIRGERPQESSQEDRKCLLRERPQGSFLKVYTLDDTIDSERIDAKLEDGILLLQLGIKDAVKPRRIEIKS